ncbi:MAG: sialidase family protein, partial [bacterium]
MSTHRMWSRTSAACLTREVKSAGRSAVLLKLHGCIALTVFLVLAVAGTGFAQNRQVNQDLPGTLQNTACIDAHLNPMGPAVLVAAYGDSPWAPSPDGIGASYSHDGGFTWFDSAPIPTAFGNDFDPTVTSDWNGTWYTCMSSFDAFPPANMNSGIFVTMSLDGGMTFTPVGAPVAVMSGPAGTMPWITKPRIDADHYFHTGSQFAGNIYVVHEADLPGPTPWTNSPSDIMFNSSNNQGWNWVPPGPMPQVNDMPGQQFLLWPDLDPGSDGRVVVGWLDTPYWYQAQGQIVTDQTFDGGATFGQDVPAVTFWTVPQTQLDVAFAPTNNAMSNCSVAVNPGDPNHIGIAFVADPDNGTSYENRIDINDLPAGFADAHLGIPSFGGDNLTWTLGQAVACWIDDRNVPSDVMFNRSGSGPPNLWTGPEVVVSTPNFDHRGPNNANIAASGFDVHVVWDEWVGVDFSHLIWYNRSGDEGTTWLPSSIYLDNRYCEAYEPIVVCNHMNNVCVVWRGEQINGDINLFCNYSMDGGLTFQPNEIQLPTGNHVISHDVAAIYDMATHCVYVAWAEASAAGGSVIQFSVSLNGGATWAAPTRLDWAPGTSVAYNPRVCCQASDVYVAWVDNRTGGVDDIYYRMSSMNGVMNWLNEVRLDTGTAPGAARDYGMQMCCGQGSVHVTWESDQNNIGAYTEDIYVNTALLNGMNWQGPQRVDLGSPPGTRHSCNPRISVGGGDGTPQVYVCYMDERNSAAPGSGAGFDIYANRSLDGGVTYDPADFRVDVGDQPGLTDSYYPQVSYGSAPAFIYEDE